MKGRAEAALFGAFLGCLVTIFLASGGWPILLAAVVQALVVLACVIGPEFGKGERGDD